jgi:hypothetical protein
MWEDSTPATGYSVAFSLIVPCRAMSAQSRIFIFTISTTPKPKISDKFQSQAQKRLSH